MTGLRLIADIGGTNARFACVDEKQALSHFFTLEVADHATFDDALAHYLATDVKREAFSDATIAAAGPVKDGTITLTNCDWRINAGEVSTLLHGKPVRLVNDLEAVAVALPYLNDNELRWIGSARPAAMHMDTRMLAVNVGTGFGAATVIATGNGWASCPSEAGHMTLDIDATQNLDGLLGQARHVSSIEDVLSGPGLVALYQAAEPGEAVAPANTSDGQRSLTPQQIIARSGNDPTAAKVLAAITCTLGSVTGNLVLASAAWGGAYLCGSVAKAWAEYADIETFRRHFENKGKMTASMHATPTAIILASDPAFIGLAAARIP